MFMVTGGGMPQHMRQSLQDHLLYGSVLMLYGMTEVAGVVASTIPFQPTSNSVGQLASNYKMKVRRIIESFEVLKLIKNIF